MENRKTALVQKSNKRDDNVGYLKPIYTINDLGFHDRVGSEPVRKEKFPNSGTILVYRDFRYIYEECKRFELFQIDYEESTRFEEQSNNSCKYQSLHADVSTYEKLPLLIKQNRLLELNDPITLPYQNHKYVFIEMEDFVIGPYSITHKEFNTNSEEDEIYDYDEFIDNNDETVFDYTVVSNDETDELGLDISYANVVFKFAKNDIEKYVVTNQKSRFENEFCIFNLKEIISEIAPIDYILNESDSDIVKWVDKYSLPKNQGKEGLESFQTFSDEKNPIHKKRFEKYTLIKEKNTNWVNFIDSFLREKYFNSQDGQTKINQYIENHKEELIKETSEEIKEEALQRNKKLYDEIEKLKIEYDEVKEKIEKAFAERAKLLDSQEIIKTKNEELQKIETLIKDKEGQLGILEGIEKAKKDYDEEMSLLARLNKKIDEKQNELNELEELTKEKAEKKLDDLYLYVRAITEAQETTKAKDVKTFFYTSLEVNKFQKEFVDLKTYFKEATRFLKFKNRNFTELEVINFFTCLHQNFVTVLVGLPGVGKTSLSNLLSQFVCPPEFSLEIPVGRGWSTKKNLLGFFNPLKNEYQSDEYGLMDRIREFNRNFELSDVAPLIVILDEANLSPIEHYWSDFISLCDEDKYSNRFINTLDLNGNSKLKLPDGFKFIFTVNHDHTTELLSPRLVDRACIIKLEHKISKSNDLDETSADELRNEFSSFYSQRIINEYFRQKNTPFTVNEEKIFDEVLGIVTETDFVLGKQIPVSPRKIRSIKTYCSVTRDVYKEFGGLQFLSLDYAILQNIIPLINGQGGSFRQRLEKLKDVLQQRSLTKSAKEVEDILIKGKEFDYYSYF